jgi:HK97 family phage prohead protease
METKHLPFEATELKFNDEDWRVEGYASVFDSVDKVGDTVQRGAFIKSLNERMPSMRFEHLRWATPGMWTKAEEDERGLKVIGQLTRDHSLAKDLRASLRHGTVRGLSIGFVIKDAEQDGPNRILKEIDLHEVSFTANPAEPQAVVTAWKSELGNIESLADFERFLRDSGDISKSMATALTSHLKTLLLSDSERVDEEIKREVQRTDDELQALIARWNFKLRLRSR